MNKYDVIENCVPITLSKGEADAVFFFGYIFMSKLSSQYKELKNLCMQMKVCQMVVWRKLIKVKLH